MRLPKKVKLSCCLILCILVGFNLRLMHGMLVVLPSYRKRRIACTILYLKIEIYIRVCNDTCKETEKSIYMYNNRVF